MSPIEVVIIGIAVVFLTLSVLTIATYLMGYIINKYFLKEEKYEKEKVAAIVASIQSQTGGGK